MKQVLSWVLAVMTLGIIMFAVICHFLGHGELFQADAIQIPVFAHQFVYQHLKIAEWYFPAVHYFFPDMFFVTLITLFIKNIIAVIWVYAVLQMCAYVLIIGLLLRVALNSSKGFMLGILAGLISLLMLAKGALNQELLTAVMQSNFHFGGTLMVFVAIAAFIIVIDAPSKAAGWFLALVVFLGGLSDVLVIFYFVIPAMIILVLLARIKQIAWLRAIKLILMLLVVYAICHSISHSLPHNFARAHMHLRLSNLYTHLGFFIWVMEAFFKREPIVFIIWIGFIVLAPVSVIHTYKKNLERNNRLELALLFFWVLVLFGIVGMILFDNNLQYAPSYVGLRHMQPLILGPVFVGIPLLLYKHVPGLSFIFRPVVFWVVLILLSAMALYQKPIFRSELFWHYQPSELSCFDRHVRALHLHAGFSGYWSAKPFTLLNHSGFVLAAIDGNKLTPYYWLNSSTIYRQPKFDFILVKAPAMRLNVSFLEQMYGMPTSSFHCGASYLVYVYKDGRLNRLVFDGESHLTFSNIDKLSSKKNRNVACFHANSVMNMFDFADNYGNLVGI